MDSNLPQRRRRRGFQDPQPAGQAGLPAAAGALAAGVGEMGQLALWMAATLAGMVTAVLASRAPFFKSLIRKLGRKVAGARRHKPTRRQSLPMLAEAIVGNSKCAIAAVFGPPRSAVMCGTPAVGMGDVSYWQADTWYYPLPASQRRDGGLAMAIEFADDSAHRVQFLAAA